MDPSQRFCFYPPQYIAVCPPAPLFPHQRLPRLRPLPQLPQHGPPYVTWVRAHESYLAHAVDADFKASTHSVLVGRGYCGDAMVPASVICQPDCNIPSIIEVEGTWQGDHYHCDAGEMLVVLRGRAEWIPASDGDVPANALPISQSPQGETMYCARASVNGVLALGRVMASERACFAMHNRREVAVKNYEVLVIV